MVRLSLIALVGSLSVAALVVGCGADGDGSVDNSAAPTKAEFIKQGDAICEKANRVEAAKLSAFDDSQGSPKSNLARQLRTIIMPAVRKEVEEIGDLDFPPDNKDEANAVVAAYEEAVVAGKDISSLLDGKSREFEKAFKLAQRFGFKVCGTY